MLSIIALFGVSHVASAAACDQNNPCGNGNPALLQNIWGSAPIVAAGTVVRDEAGFSSVCPVAFAAGCYDLTHTSFYRDYMLNVGRQLKTLGQTGGIFGYWINLAK